MGLTRISAQQISDIDYKQAVRVITTTNVTLSGSAPATVDGVNLAVNDRILVAGQTTGSQNGLYYVQTVGAGSTGTWVRTADANQNGEIEAGMIVMVTEGTVYKDTQWKLTTNNPIVIGTTALVFEQNSAFAFGNVYANGTAVLATSVGDTLTLTAGNNIAITGNASAKSVAIAVTGISLTSISSGTSNVNIVSSGGNVTVGVGGTGNVTVFSTGGANVTGYVTATGNVTGGNLVTAGQVSATGNITGGNLLINTDAVITGNLTVNGNTTTINSNTITTNDLAITLGNNQNTGLALNGAGIDVGNNSLATWKFNNATTSWQSNIAVMPAANATLNLGGASNYWNVVYFTTGTMASNGTITMTGTASQLSGANLVSASYLTGTLTTAAQPNITSVGSLSSLTVTGNVTGGNLTTTGIANIGTLAVTGTSSHTGNATFGNISATGTANITGNVTVGNLTTTIANVTTFNSAQGGNVTGTLVATSANAQFINQTNGAGYVTVAGYLTVAGNITGGNVISNALVTSATLNTTGNANVGNLGTAGLITATGNITGGNLVTAGQVNATGNITGGNLNISGNIFDTSSQLVIATTTASNIALAVNNSNIVVVTSTGANIAGTLNATGNANVGNIGATAGVFSGTLSVTGNANVGNLGTAGLITATGNVTGGNLTTAGTANIGTLAVTGTSSHTGNATFGNISGTGIATFTGTITSNGATNGTAFAVGNSAVSNVGLGFFPTAGTRGDFAIRDYSTVFSSMYFDVGMGGSAGGEFRFRLSNAFNDIMTVNSAGITTSARVYGLELNSTQSSGDEGGQINMAKPVTNNSLAGNIIIDVYQNKVRFFEDGGTNRGAYIDLTSCNASVGTNLLAGGGGGTPGGSNTFVQFNDGGVFGGVAGFTFDKSTNTFTANIIASSNNGLGTNFKVGDDAWIGDINTADTIGIKGQQNPANAYIVFGNSDATGKLGRSGTGPLTYAGAFTATGNITGGNLTTAGTANVGTLAVTGTSSHTGNATFGNISANANVAANAFVSTGIFQYAVNTISSNLVVPAASAGYNIYSVGPLTLGNAYTITAANGTLWVVL